MKNTSVTTASSIFGYTLSESLYSSERTDVYRAIQEDSQCPVVIKVLSAEYPTLGDLVQFRNQYAIARPLHHPGIVKPLTLERYGNGYALVMPDNGFMSLATYWHHRDETLDVVFKIALQLTDVLHYLIDQRVIHKDIKPANILIHPETQTVQLIDFSIASVLPKERQDLANPNVLEGTLAYISPEQTGRMNRGIDYRSDLYALGVTLYELLTGELPFPTDDAMALVHSHMTAQPPMAHARNSAVPPILSEIVAKLMAKNAEDRYQSALGLQWDLERCREEWQDKGTRIWFPLGERDISDRFLIPEKLYGRQDEVMELLAAFNRTSAGQPELMLVAGFSGIGKTAVVNEVHKPITRQSGYFIKGKFDQLNRNIPFSAFVQALRGLMGQILGESDAALAIWKQRILQALGNNAQVILEVIPELELIIGQQPNVPELSGTAAQHRFNLLFSRFIQVFATQDHPLVIFLDDLQWADTASLTLLKQLMLPLDVEQKSDAGIQSEERYLLVLGAYRDNEVHVAHPLMLTLSALEQEQVSVRTLTLAPLALVDVTHLVADTLRCDVQRADPLSQLIYAKTEGNPFFTTQFLQRLHQEGCITFHCPDFSLGNDSEGANPLHDLHSMNVSLEERKHEWEGGWQCDLGHVRQLSLSDDVVEFMVERLRKLPDIDQMTLKLAACLGNSFDLDTVALVAELPPEEVAMNLWRSLQDGLVVPEGETYKFFQDPEEPGLCDDLDNGASQTAAIIHYRFLHDRVQQSAYALIPDDQKQVIHLQIGQRLLASTPPAQRDNRIFDIVSHLNQGRDLLETSNAQLELAQLNLQAGYKAKEGTAYQAAFEYFATGLNILSMLSAQALINLWGHHYDLTLALYREGAIAAHLVGQLDTMAQWIAVALDHTHTLLDRIPFYETQIQSYVAQKQLSDAIQLGIATLEELGESFSQQPTPEDFGRGIEAISTRLAQRPIEALIHLPAMSDPNIIAILKILLRLSSVLVMAAPQLMPFCMFKAVQLSISDGNSFLSAPAYVTYGMILCGAVSDITAGYQFGQLALQVVDTYEGKAVQAKTLVRFNAGVRHWQEPLRDTLDDLAQGYQLALEVGDLESAAICAEVYGYHSYFSGKELGQLAQELKIYSQGIESIQQQTMLYWNESYRQHVLNLQGHCDDPCLFAGPAYDESIHLPMQQEYHDGFGMGMVYLLKAIASYLFQQYDQALSYLETTASFLQSFAPFAAAPAFYFYRVLTYLASVPEPDLQPASPTTSQSTAPTTSQSTAPTTSRPAWPDWFDSYCSQLQHWATHAPTNHQHKVDLIEAEQLRLQGQRYEAADRYDRAIAGAKQNGYGQEEALANECAARFYLSWGKEKVAAGYMQEAYYGYAHWGAKAKTDDLEQCYPHLLQPILHLSPQPANILDTLRTLAPKNLSTHSSKSLNSSTTSLNTALDFASVLKASQAISTIISLDELLQQLTHMILENSGGDRCALILPNDTGTWEIRAIATSNTTDLCVEALDNNPNVPVQLIHYVKNTQTVMMIDNVQTDAPIFDDYLNRQQPQSVLCLPLLNQSTVSGILYVQNQFTRGAFTSDRIAVVNFLCAQAAITLENTRLYRLEQEKTAQLQRINAILENSSDYIGLADADGNLLWVNHQLMQLDPERYGNLQNGLNIADFHPQWVMDIVMKEGLPAVIEHGTWLDELAVLGAHGNEIPVSLLLIAHKSSQGDVEYFSAIMRDISQQKKAELAILEKSQALEIALEDLQRTELKMVQSEKMSALGNLVAGVAHEINNPLGFVSGNVNELKLSLNDVIDCLQAYRDAFPNPGGDIQELLEDTEIDFVLDDLPKMLGAMQAGCDRIRGISTSLRIFSRADTETKVKANIHEGIDSTILILKYRLKAKDFRPEIQVICDYGDLPDIHCFPGQLNQVFMNILANAIDMFDEMAQGYSFDDLKEKTQQITIQTQLVDTKSVEISISDNGQGMSEEVCAKIFDRKFTTKAVGKGTGLGLAIAHQVITEKHDGVIKVESSLEQGTSFILSLPIQ